MDHEVFDRFVQLVLRVLHAASRRKITEEVPTALVLVLLLLLLIATGSD